MELPPIEALIARLAHENPSWRADAESALIARGDAAVPALIAAIGHPSLSVRVHVVRVLGRLRAERAGPAIAELLGSAELGLAMAAQRALVEMGAVDAVVAMSDHSVAARARALRVMELIGDRRGEGAAGRELSASEPEVRAQAAATMIAVAAENGIERVASLLGDSEKLVRYSAAEALAKLNVKRALPVLTEAAADPEEERWKFDELIAEIEAAISAGTARE